MSHGALQKALVIALHDEEFVAAMHDDPDRTLAPFGLDAHERRQLLAVDRRAWRTDPLRRRRTLRTLAEELKVSTTLALAETRSLAFAEGFFGSRFFREAVGSRAPLVPAFADYLADAAATGRLATPQLAGVIELERTTARMRRDKLRPPPPGLGLAPGVAVRLLDGGVLETVNRVERYLFELSLMPQAALCADAPQPPALPAIGASPPLHLLFTPSQTGVSLTTIDADLHRVLDALATARPRGQAVAALVELSIPRTRAPALLESLLAEGLLAEAP